MRIAHISDLHFTRSTFNPFRLLSKRLLGHLNWIFCRRWAFCQKKLQPLPSLFKKLHVDLVLIGGDVSTTALFEEFEAAKGFVKKLSQPWLATAGNHDCYTWRSFWGKHFYRLFSNARKEITHPVEFFQLKAHGVEAHRSGPFWIVILDTARATSPYSSQGLFSEKIEAHLKEVLDLIGADEKIVMLNHYPLFQNDSQRRSLQRSGALEALVKSEERIVLYLHGHTHRHAIADLQPSGYPVVLDSGSVSFQKGSWNLIDVTQEGCSVRPYWWKEGEWVNEEMRDFAWKR